MQPIPLRASRARQSSPADGRASGARAGAEPLDLADPTMDPLDRILGRAMFDPAFGAELLANPAAALATEPMPLALKRALVGLRARSLDELAGLALRAERRAEAGYSPEVAPQPAVDRWRLAESAV